jgi:hypothetical protein
LAFIGVYLNLLTAAQGRLWRFEAPCLAVLSPIDEVGGLSIVV